MSPLFTTAQQITTFGPGHYTISVADWELPNLPLIIADNIVDTAIDLGSQYFPVMLQEQDSQTYHVAFINLLETVNNSKEFLEIFPGAIKGLAREEIRQRFQRALAVIHEYTLQLLREAKNVNLPFSLGGEPLLWRNNDISIDSGGRNELAALRRKGIELLSAEGACCNTEIATLTSVRESNKVLYVTRITSAAPACVMLRFPEIVGRGTYKSVYKEISHLGETFACCVANTVREDRARAKEHLRRESNFAVYLKQSGARFCLNIFCLKKYIPSTSTSTERVGGTVTDADTVSYPSSEMRDLVNATRGITSEQIGYLAEFCDGGDLEQFFKKQSDLDQLPLDQSHVEEQIKKICHQFFVGLADIHGLDLVHLDLKLGNIFLKGAEYEVRIGDFGCMASAKDEVGFKGTLGYSDPHFFKSCRWDTQTEKRKINPKKEFDIWSAGVILYRIYHGKSPWSKDAIKALDDDGDVLPLEQEVLKLRESLATSLKQVDQFIVRMLDPELNNRPTAAEVATFFEKELGQGGTKQDEITS